MTNPNSLNLNPLNKSSNKKNSSILIAENASLTSILAISQTHYENFPVASIILPKHLRRPIALIYTFARLADDFADEGNLPDADRLNNLNHFKSQLDLISANAQSQSELFNALGEMVREFDLPLQPFYDLLSAFSQDVTKSRYASFSEIQDYCTRSANPIGQLLLHLYQLATPQNIIYANNICTSLQLINFYQDIAIDFDDTHHKRRIYLCQDEMARFNVTEAQIANKQVDKNWQQLMRFNINRAQNLLNSGKPLGRILPGRLGLEMRLIINGGEHILKSLQKVDGDIFKHRPVLKPWHWPIIGFKAFFYN